MGDEPVNELREYLVALHVRDFSLQMDECTGQQSNDRKLEV